MPMKQLTDIRDGVRPPESLSNQSMPGVDPITVTVDSKMTYTNRQGVAFQPIQDSSAF